MTSQANSFRLTGINHLTYTVQDKDRALRFWEDVLGVKQIPSQVESDHLYWLQLPSGAMVHLVEHADAPSMPAHHGAFEVDDIEAAYAFIRSKGVETTELKTRDDGQREFKLNDSEGNQVEICTKSGFGVLV
ncbi:MAG: VOC family protein [SAR202 cluster bacterium]|jgi:catechol 2,3-dioxygenase-like lactoylglutathione lyase family enzyme|nr:VOC family protein [SAR202 cluster bacterium]MDP6300469.1 VOC family protein [SAR202 cluster bacterium]MDP7102108.1 VOC family protein [SAR202 cluster bacterium]MDP7224101.1 VOC family protein [SAR202 cluster bacterium]|tara:strand:- start:2205 stop:2600 length:396 start_codon:yes stop_codon:yes gene_type:complete